MATVAEVKKKAATKLGFSPSNALSASVDAQMQDAYDETYTELSELDLITWAQAGTVPDKVADYVADIMAFKRLDIYGTAEMAQIVTAKYSVAESKIRRMIAPKYQSVTNPVDY